MAREYITVGAVGVHYSLLKGKDSYFSFPNLMITTVFKTRMTALLKVYQTIICMTGLNKGVDILFGIASVELKQYYGERVKIYVLNPSDTYINTLSGEEREVCETIRWNADNEQTYHSGNRLSITEQAEIQQRIELDIASSVHEAYVLGEHIPNTIGEVLLENAKKGRQVHPINTGVQVGKIE